MGEICSGAEARVCGVAQGAKIETLAYPEERGLGSVWVEIGSLSALR